MNPVSNNYHKYHDTIAAFLDVVKNLEAEFNYDRTVEQEQEDKVQDLLHLAEFQPHTLPSDAISKLHEIRTTRREAKKALEISRTVKNTFERDAIKNAKSQLQDLLGQLRKINNTQISSFYTTKTNTFTEINKYITTEEPQTISAEEIDDYSTNWW
jgi:uncharacterized protein YjgD (DUF1641 family)